jgi:hypothetical protein
MLIGTRDLLVVTSLLKWSIVTLLVSSGSQLSVPLRKVRMSHFAVIVPSHQMF